MAESQCQRCGKTVRHPRAVQRTYCSRDCKGDAQRESNPWGKDWLYQKYVIEGLSCPEIASIVGRHPKSVFNWLKGFGIPTRPRGSSDKGRFAPGTRSFLGKTHTPEAREKIRQARIREGSVPYLKNGVHHLKGKRGPETPNWKGGVSPERQIFYGTQEWKDAVKAVWHRDDAKCRRCGVDRRDLSYEESDGFFAIHHIVSFAVKHLRAEVSNLVLLCKPCHLFVHSKANTSREFIA